jgi:AhpD family alkylhydroperoxidase
MLTIELPENKKAGQKNKELLEYFKERLGRVPNLYASMMHSENALTNYYQFHTTKVSLSKRECEAIMLVVSQENNSLYCLSAHTMIGKLNGFNEDQITQLRRGVAEFDKKLDALVKFIKNVVEEKIRCAGEIH